jgi:hypothetical protein
LQESPSLIGREITKSGGIVSSQIVRKLRFICTARSGERGGKRRGWVSLMAILRECIRCANIRHEHQNDGRLYESSFH